MAEVELGFGAFGTVYYDGDGRVLGSMQYGPAQLLPRAYELPGGPPSDDAMLVTCAYVVDAATPWVLQSLFLAAIGEARDRGASSIEAFSYRFPEGESAYERFRVHKTVFPADFLGDFGFRIVRSAGRVGLARLELGCLQPVQELRDLDRVERRALAQVVAREEQREALLDRRVAADAADEHLVDRLRLA